MVARVVGVGLDSSFGFGVEHMGHRICDAIRPMDFYDSAELRESRSLHVCAAQKRHVISPVSRAQRVLLEPRKRDAT